MGDDTNKQDTNKKVYATRAIVRYYTYLKTLQPAEQSILDLLQDQLSRMHMLDIGVGGGRTTQHFSNRVMQYMGIDYSADMIAACQKQFRTSPSTVAFNVCDARDLSQFPDNAFDFVLFSFNGIDYSSHSDRLTILQEISRVGKPGGYFFFSSHNLQGIERDFDWQTHVRFNPITTYVNLVMFALLRLRNRAIAPKRLKASKHATIKDESHNFSLNTYYIRPQEQVRQLEADFRDVKIFSWKNGLEIANEDELISNTDMWLYYLCIIK